MPTVNFTPFVVDHTMASTPTAHGHTPMLGRGSQRAIDGARAMFADVQRMLEAVAR